MRHFTLDEAPLGTLYIPYTQIMPDVRDFFASAASVVVRTSATPTAPAHQIRAEFRAVDGDLPTSEVRSGDQIVASVLAPRCFALARLGLFATLSFGWQ